MAKVSKYLCLAIFALLSCAQYVRAAEEEEAAPVVIEDDEYGDSERAFLVVRKFVKEEVVVQGRNMTVKLHVYNGGISAASNVEIKDSIPAELTLVEGSLDISAATLKVGGVIKHTYVVVPKVGDATIKLPPAEVTYIAEPDSSDSQVGRSAPVSVVVLTPAQKIQRTALLVGKFVTLGIVKTPTDWRNLAIILFAASAFIGVNWSVKSMSSAQTQRARKKALEELEKQE